MLTAASSETVYFKRSNMHARKPDVVLGVFTSWNHYITIRIYLMCLTPFCSLFSPTNLSRCFISVIYHHSSFLQISVSLLMCYLAVYVQNPQKTSITLHQFYTKKYTKDRYIVLTKDFSYSFEMCMHFIFVLLYFVL